MLALLANLLRLVPLLAKLAEYLDRTMRGRQAAARRDAKDTAADAAIDRARGLHRDPAGEQPTTVITPAVPRSGDTRPGIHP